MPVARFEITLRRPLAGELAYEPPRTETEAAIAGIWAELLGTDRVGHDSLRQSALPNFAYKDRLRPLIHRRFKWTRVTLEDWS